MKKVVFKKYLEENSQAQRLERVILGIKKEARLRSNEECLRELKKFKIHYYKEIKKINDQINTAKQALKRKKELKKKMVLMEDCVNSNLKVVLIRLDPKEVKKINQKKKKTKKQKRWLTRWHTGWKLLELGQNIKKNTKAKKCFC